MFYLYLLYMYIETIYRSRPLHKYIRINKSTFMQKKNDKKMNVVKRLEFLDKWPQFSYNVVGVDECERAYTQQ